jgi:hypothetical protein
MPYRSSPAITLAAQEISGSVSAGTQSGRRLEGSDDITAINYQLWLPPTFGEDADKHWP